MKLQNICHNLKSNVSNVMIGCDEAVELILLSMLVSGHVLLEDVPGTGKTMLAKSIAKSLSINFNRIQFTPDLLPSDIIGVNYFNMKEQKFEFKKGPVFSNIVLADEINRAAPRTQAGLLEAMEEYQVTVDGNSYSLDRPFVVLATQNPVENAGTFPLPEAQLDRFTVKLKLGYMNLENEKEILKKHGSANPIETIAPVLSAEDLLYSQAEIDNVFISDNIIDYMMEIINKTRNSDKILLGVSTRGSLAFYKCLKAYVALKGREYALPDDVKYLSKFVLPHRIITVGVSYSKKDANSEIINEIVNSVTVPTENFDKK